MPASKDCQIFVVGTNQTSSELINGVHELFINLFDWLWSLLNKRSCLKVQCWPLSLHGLVLLACIFLTYVIKVGCDVGVPVEVLLEVVQDIIMDVLDSTCLDRCLFDQ